MLTRWKSVWVSSGSSERSEILIHRFTKKEALASLSGPCDSTITGWSMLQTSRIYVWLQTVQCIWYIMLAAASAVPLAAITYEAGADCDIPCQRFTYMPPGRFRCEIQWTICRMSFRRWQSSHPGRSADFCWTKSGIRESQWIPRQTADFDHPRLRPQ